MFVDLADFLETMCFTDGFAVFLAGLLVGASLWRKIISQEPLQLKQFAVQVESL